MPSLTLQESLSLATEYLDKRCIQQASALGLKMYASCGSKSEIRAILRECIRRGTLAETQLWVESTVRKLAIESDFISDASLGWQYSLLLDTDFICSDIYQETKDARLSEPSNSPSRTLQDGSSAEFLLNTLVDCTGIQECYAQLQALPNLECNALRADSTLDDSSGPQDLGQYLTAMSCGGKLSIVIVGAGCTGLALANALKLGFGDHVDILILENRVSQAHHKVPYCRNWLTNIPLGFLHGVLDSRLTTIMARVGDQGYMGLPLNVFESLLLLANKTLGCQFLFEQEFNLSVLATYPVNLVIDATGGRLANDDSWSEQCFATQCVVARAANFAHGFERFGVRKNLPSADISIPLGQIGAKWVPLHEGGAIQVPMFKITGLPASLYEPVMRLIANRNEDCKFYIWPGKLKQEINELLIIVNLARHEFEKMRRLVRKPMSLNEFCADVGQTTEDQRLIQVAQLLEDLVCLGPEVAVRVEPPFIFKPYARPLTEQGEFLHGSLLLRIGDSVYNGNPKTGNGLGRHLAWVVRFHDELICAALSHTNSLADGLGVEPVPSQ